MKKIFIPIIVLIFIQCSVSSLPDTALSDLKGIMYFNSNRTGNNEIYKMNANGSNIVNLSLSPKYEDIMAAVSPDSSKIAFMRGQSYDFQTYEIWIMNIDGTNQKQLTHNDFADGHVDFAPDSRRIVYVSWRDGNEELYIMDINTGIEKRITDNPAGDNDPDWSPCGNYIAFKSTRAYYEGGEEEFLDPNFEIFVIDTMGNNIERLTYDNYSDHDPDFSPDGSEIAFLRVIDREGNDVWIMDRDGSNQKNISLTKNNWYTSFSADGSHITFCTSRGENTDIYVMDKDGTNQIRVTYGFATDEFPAWK